MFDRIYVLWASLMGVPISSLLFIYGVQSGDFAAVLMSFVFLTISGITALRVLRNTTFQSGDFAPGLAESQVEFRHDGQRFLSAISSKLPATVSFVFFVGLSAVAVTSVMYSFYLQNERDFVVRRMEYLQDLAENLQHRHENEDVHSLIAKLKNEETRSLVAAERIERVAENPDVPYGVREILYQIAGELKR